MARRLKSLDRSRRSPVLPRPLAHRPGQPLIDTPALGASPGTSDFPAEEFESHDDSAATGTLSETPAARDETPEAIPHPFPSPRSLPDRPIPPVSAGPAATGWDWFAQWPFPTQFLCFAVVLAAGVAWTNHSGPTSPSTHSSAATQPSPPKKTRPHPRPELFDWLNRLRETQVVTDQLESEFADAQQFYRDYALDEFLEFDPWSLGADEVATLTHFCDHGFFTVEREILIRILERKILDQPPDTPHATQGAAARLEAAAHNRESRLASLREAAELYRRGRTAEIIVPANLTPEEDQARRARLVDKLATVRRERDRLDARIAELNAQLR